MVLRVPEIDSGLAPEDGDLQPAQEGKHVPLGPQRVPQADDIGAELVEAGDAFAARSLDDVLFELVQQRLKPIEMRKIGVDEGVEDGVGKEVRTGLQHLGISLAESDADVLERRKRRTVDRDDEFLGHEKGELVGIDLLGPYDRPSDDEHHVFVLVHFRRELPVLRILECERVATEQRPEFLERALVRVDHVHPGDRVLLGEIAAPSDGHILLLEKIGRRVGEDLDADHRAANLSDSL